MSLKIRLVSTGRHGQRLYRVVVGEQKSKIDGKVSAVIGFYNPTVKPAEIKIDAKEYKNWLSKGALPSATVAKLFDSINEKTS